MLLHAVMRASQSELKPLALGKLPINVLKETVLKRTGATSVLLATPPLPGIDFAAVRIGKKYLIVSADPITGVSDDIGRYAISVSANDVATSGNRPQFAESVLLLPEGADQSYVGKVAEQMHFEAKRLGISIIGGHTEITAGLKRPIVIVTTFALAGRYVSSADARSGDTIMMTKTAGIEGTLAILGAQREPRLERKGPSLIDQISVVEEAVGAHKTGFVSAMHDCTEGGVLGGVFEMSVASGLGFVLMEQSIPISRKTKEVCRRLSIDPLKLISSGALLVSVRKGRETHVQAALQGICQITSIGHFNERGRILVRRDGSRDPIKDAPEDELWRVLGRLGRKSDGFDLAHSLLPVPS